ncbi:hypothetical protein TI01_0979 [Lysobacter sp. A03]|nr:hypothetical protein TI01_0979 [Lysobacter sp. A03]
MTTIAAIINSITLYESDIDRATQVSKLNPNSVLRSIAAENDSLRMNCLT